MPDSIRHPAEYRIEKILDSGFHRSDDFNGVLNPNAVKFHRSKPFHCRFFAAIGQIGRGTHYELKRKPATNEPNSPFKKNPMERKERVSAEMKKEHRFGNLLRIF